MSTTNSLRPNGTYPVEVKTLNGDFVFDLARFKTDDGSTNYFREANVFGQSSRYESQGLPGRRCGRFCLSLCNADELYDG